MNTSGAVPFASGRRPQWKDEPLVLFVEGYSDLTFYAEVMEHLGYGSGEYFIKDLGGKGRSKLEREAGLLLRPDSLATMSAVAVILDADDHAAGAFEMARSALSASVRVDVSRPGEWTSIPGGNTRFGIFIAQRTDGTGEAESLAWEAWRGMPANRPLQECIDRFIECARSKGFPLKSVDKVRVGAALAVQNEDDPRLGPGARARLFDLDASELEPLRRFLQGMRPPP